MARVPVGSVLHNSPEVGWPTPVTNNVWMLPGIPDLFRLKLLTARAWLRGPTPLLSRSLFLRLGRASLEATPGSGRRASPEEEVEIGSYPKWFDPSYRTLVTFDAADAEAAQAALEDLRARVSPS